MPAYCIPYDIQVEILKRLVPVKSLIRFRSVSKQWKSLIHSFKFITDHSLNQPKPRHLLVISKGEHQLQFLSVVDDDTFPHHKFSPFVPPTVKLLNHVSMLDCSNGLLCLYGSHRYLEKNNLIVVWNPSIRKSIGILMPLESVVGFGICPKTSDIKIVKITRITSKSIDWQAEVFTLSSRAWRSVPMPYKLSTIWYNQLLIDGIIHWVVWNSERQWGIITFDLISEGFGEVHLPEDCLAGIPHMSISKHKESLVVASCFYEDYARMCDVWMMKKDGGLKPLYTKLFTANLGPSDGLLASHVIGFRKNGEPVVEYVYSNDHYSLSSTLKVYDPCLKNINDLGIGRSYRSMFKMTSYSESLLLLNQPDYMIQS